MIKRITEPGKEIPADIKAISKDKRFTAVVFWYYLKKAVDKIKNIFK